MFSLRCCNHYSSIIKIFASSLSIIQATKPKFLSSIISGIVTMQLLFASEQESNRITFFSWLAVQGCWYPVQSSTHIVVLVPKLPPTHHPLRLMYWTDLNWQNLFLAAGTLGHMAFSSCSAHLKVGLMSGLGLCCIPSMFLTFMNV